MLLQGRDVPRPSIPPGTTNTTRKWEKWGKTRKNGGKCLKVMYTKPKLCKVLLFPFSSSTLHFMCITDPTPCPHWLPLQSGYWPCWPPDVMWNVLSSSTKICAKLTGWYCLSIPIGLQYALYLCTTQEDSCHICVLMHPSLPLILYPFQQKKDKLQNVVLVVSRLSTLGPHKA